MRRQKKFRTTTTIIRDINLTLNELATTEKMPNRFIDALTEPAQAAEAAVATLAARYPEKRITITDLANVLHRNIVLDVIASSIDESRDPDYYSEEYHGE